MISTLKSLRTPSPIDISIPYGSVSLFSLSLWILILSMHEFIENRQARAVLLGIYPYNPKRLSLTFNVHQPQPTWQQARQQTNITYIIGYLAIAHPSLSPMQFWYA
jgi:hypothetical protein